MRSKALFYHQGIMNSHSWYSFNTIYKRLVTPENKSKYSVFILFFLVGSDNIFSRLTEAGVILVNGWHVV